mmetsp:Transcript_30467/g.45119  ORF Transcript_30467/g.45119 Transcript_30467/m.45119 type:complete len:473 (-) Transcript_30467:63-1481(-)
MCAGPEKITPEKKELQDQSDASSSSSTVKDEKRLEQAKAVLKQGIFYGAASVAVMVGANSFTMPHRQNRLLELGCDTMCYGTFTSVRSMLGLIGSALMGRISDQSSYARRMCLHVGTLAALLGMVIAAETDSLEGLYYSLIPASLFAQNFNIMKALFADYHDALHTGPAERAASVGTLGMSVGLAFMVGPLSGATFIKTYTQANRVGIIFIILSGLLTLKVPDPVAPDNTKAINDGHEPKKKEKKTSVSGFFAPIVDFVDVKAARTPGALVLILLRLCMGLAFHVFSTMWMPWAKKTYGFGPGDLGKFMSFIGLTYALSQGFIAKYLLRLFGANKSHKARVNMILACCVTLSVGRYFVFQTSSLMTVYALMGCVVISLGLVNTILTADTSYLAPSDEIGSLFGILAAVESASGMVGPLLGGYLSLLGGIHVSIGAIVVLYAIAFVLVLFGYERWILSRAPKSSSQDKKQKVL